MLRRVTGHPVTQELIAMAIDSEQQPPAVHTPPYLAALPAPALDDYAPPAPPAYAPPYEAPASAPVAAARKKQRPAWIVPAAIAVVGLIASGSLGYLFYSTNQKLENTQAQLTDTQLALDSTNKDLKAEKAQAAYVQIFQNDMGRESTDFATLTECDSYSACRTATSDMLSDTQAFQSDHQTAEVPPQFANVDSMLGDALTAEIAALKELQSAISSNDMTRINNGFNDVNDATLSLFKTESALGKLIA